MAGWDCNCMFNFIINCRTAFLKWLCHLAGCNRFSKIVKKIKIFEKPKAKSSRQRAELENGVGIGGSSFRKKRGVGPRAGQGCSLGDHVLRVGGEK